MASENSGRAHKKRSRGRPSGTKLSDEQKALILAAVEAGATDHTAAQAAGIAPRTFRELRQRAEGRHPTRGALPQLAAFFQQVDQAGARARIKREIEVAQSNPALWLKNKARSKPGMEGWSEPVPDEPEDAEPLHVPTPEELQAMVDALIASGAVIVPACPDPTCSCSYHQRGEEDEG